MNSQGTGGVARHNGLPTSNERLASLPPSYNEITHFNTSPTHPRIEDPPPSYQAIGPVVPMNPPPSYSTVDTSSSRRFDAPSQQMVKTQPARYSQQRASPASTRNQAAVTQDCCCAGCSNACDWTMCLCCIVLCEVFAQ